MFTYNNCPLCQGDKFEPFLTCKDYTVSNEEFKIDKCVNCGFKFTNPIPEVGRLGEYYKSEDYISHSNTKRGLVARAYHLVRNYTLGRKIRLLYKHVSRGTLLDYGCGTGMFLKASIKAGWKAYGVEPDSGARSLAIDGGALVSETWQELEKKQGHIRFTAITLWHVLEHVTDLKGTLNFFSKTLEPNGTLFIAVPNHISNDALHYGKYWAAYDVPRHLYHFEKSTMQNLLSQHGFLLEKTYPMVFDSFYVSLLSEKYKTGKMGYLSAFIRGLVSNLSAGAPDKYSSVIYVFRKK